MTRDEIMANLLADYRNASRFKKIAEEMAPHAFNSSMAMALAEGVSKAQFEDRMSCFLMGVAFGVMIREQEILEGIG